MRTISSEIQRFYSRWVLRGSWEYKVSDYKPNLHALSDVKLASVQVDIVFFRVTSISGLVAAH